MKFFAACLFLCFHTIGLANFSVDQIVPSGSFDTDIDPYTGSEQDNTDVRDVSGMIQYIKDDTWVAYNNFDFGTGAIHFSIEVATQNDNGKITLRDGGIEGAVLGIVNLESTGGNTIFQEFSIDLPQSISGIKNLYLTFKGDGYYIFDTRNFIFRSVKPGLKESGSELGFDLFDEESHPGSLPISKISPGIASITDETWICFKEFDFGKEANHIELKASSPSAGGKIEIRIGSIDGQLISSIEPKHTGSLLRFHNYSAIFEHTITGKHDLYFTFLDPNNTGGNLFNLQDFRITRQIDDDFPLLLDEQDGDQIPPLIEHATGMHNESKDSLPIEFNGEQANNTVDFKIRLRANPRITTQIKVSPDLSNWKTVSVTFNEGIWQTDDADVTITETTPIDGDLYLLGLKDSTTDQKLFLQLIAEIPEGNLQVYPLVQGLNPSEYYTFEVQKLSELDSEDVTTATNWLTPFAWFTKCKYNDSVNSDGTKNTAYYSRFIGGWTHTYCNFELDPHTPVVVKITRLNKDGAPSGQIQSANAHPAHKVESCIPVGNSVYVTLKHPSMISVDIDGQLDGRVTPRRPGGGWGPNDFFNNELEGVHAVTIFANPTIKDKPQIGDPGVLTVNPGAWHTPEVQNALQANNWSTLYFLPGIHQLSTDNNGTEREWTVNDPLMLQSGKNYYIPGDAIVYGNFNDRGDSGLDQNIRVFGHGTLSGEKIPHWQDPSDGEMEENHRILRMIEITKARGCVIEGITVSNPAEHGIYVWGDNYHSNANTMKWVKLISWRVNNDGGYITGNGHIEDCFFRHQDDALYIRGVSVKRCVFWSDVNGIPFRCSFISHDRDSSFPTSLPQDLIVEDCDVIYARGVFGGEDSSDFAIIGNAGGAANKTYDNGVANTGQHLIFKDIRVTDPFPLRTLLGFSYLSQDVGNGFPNYEGSWAGFQFQNITYKHAHPFGWKNKLVGSSNGGIHHWVFDNVTIAGDKLDENYLNDTSKFETENISEIIFK